MGVKDVKRKKWGALKKRTRVIFINILRARFLYESKLSSFSLITFGVAIFWCQNIGKKVACKMLMKLIPRRGTFCGELSNAKEVVGGVMRKKIESFS